MAEVSVDLELINQYLLPDLGEVTLNPSLTTGETEPSSILTTPAIMGSAALVPSTAYRFVYNQVRYLKMGYLVQRGTNFQSGEFDIISNAVKLNTDEVTMPYTAPTLTFLNTTIQTVGSVGVTFSVGIDSISVPNQPKFGLMFQITSAAPSVFPIFRAFIIKLLPLL